MMTRLIALALLALPLAAPAQAQDQSGAVIQSQLDAFNADDMALAWSFASPAIKGLFGNQSNFAMMVQSGYPMVWHSDGARIAPLREEAGALWQTVLLTDTGGALHALDYQMVETEDGWKINAVVLLPAPDIGS